jgi:ubiquinone/menaquinone biosynthesis C-methylase UbiE
MSTSTPPAWSSSHWDYSAAARYQQIAVQRHTGPFAQALVEWAVLQQGALVLDVGCGTGAVARLAAGKVGPSGRVIGIDVNAAMIEVAESLPLVLGATIEYHEQSAYQMLIPDQCVDVVLAAQLLQFLENKHFALSEMYRVLKPGGYVALSTWATLQENPYKLALVEAFTSHFGPDTVTGWRAMCSLSDAGVLQALLSEAGFTQGEVTLRKLKLTLPNLEEFVPQHINIRSSPLSEGFNTASPDVQQAVLQEISERLAQYENNGTVHIPFCSLLATGRK